MAALLLPVNPIIGRIQIQIDPQRDRPLRPEELVEKEIQANWCARVPRGGDYGNII